MRHGKTESVVEQGGRRHDRKNFSNRSIGMSRGAGVRFSRPEYSAWWSNGPAWRKIITAMAASVRQRSAASIHPWLQSCPLPVSRINGEVPPRRLLVERTEVPSSICSSLWRTPNRSHRLMAQDTALSRRKRGFGPRRDRHSFVTFAPVNPIEGIQTFICNFKYEIVVSELCPHPVRRD